MELGWLHSFSPYGRICQVPLEEFRQKLIGVFHRWGKCGAMRVDNGEPLGSPQLNVISSMAMWLIGIDIDMIFNKPRCPQANAKVERMQDVSARWADIHKAANVQQLQKNLDKEALIQRAFFPLSRSNNKTRLALFPELETSRRHFDDKFFDEKRVYQYLGKKIYVRKVATNGMVTHFGQKIAVGQKYKREFVEIKLDSQKLTWAIYLKGQMIKELKPTNLYKENIQNLTVYVKELNNVKT